MRLAARSGSALRHGSGPARGQRGQTLTEYVLIIVLVAVAALVSLKVFGKQIKGLFGFATQEIATTTGQPAPAP